MVSIIGAFLFSVVALLTLLVTLGLPLGEYTMGGKHKSLPPKLRIMTGISFFIQVFAIIVILQAGGMSPLWFPESFLQGVCYFFAAYLGLNTIMNFLSHSRKEKYIMTPLALITAICFLITAIEF